MSNRVRLANIYHGLPRPLRRLVEPVAGHYVSSIEYFRAARHIPRISKKLNERAALHAGTPIFIDLGFNNCQVMKMFDRKLSARFRFHGIEVNKQRFEQTARQLEASKRRPISLEFGAVATHDGTVQFYENGPGFGCFPYVSTTAVDNFGRPSIKNNPRIAQAVNFPVWLKLLAERYSEDQGVDPYMAVKMDIEGAEYDVLEALIENGHQELIDDLIIEFHSGRFSPEEFQDDLKSRRARILSELESSNVLVHDWI